jgi:hypothetical protein
MRMLTFDLDTRELTAALSKVNQSVIPKALSDGVNDTAKDFQATLRAGVHSRFVVRSGGFIDRMIKINREDFATPNKPEAIVRIQGPETVLGPDTRASEILTRHEEGGTHVRPSDSPFFVPAHTLRPTKTTVIPRRMYPVNLGITARRTIEGGFTTPKRGDVYGLGNTILGKRGTFLAPIGNRMGLTPGIYQRDKEAGTIQLMWLLVQEVRLKPRLRFYATGEEVVLQRGSQHLASAIERALLRILGKGYVHLGSG